MKIDEFSAFLGKIVGGDHPVRLNADQWEHFWTLINMAKKSISLEAEVESLTKQNTVLKGRVEKFDSILRDVKCPNIPNMCLCVCHWAKDVYERS